MFLTKGKVVFTKIGLSRNLLSNPCQILVKFSQQATVSSQDQSTSPPQNLEPGGNGEQRKEENLAKTSIDDQMKLIVNLQNEKQTLMDTVKSLEDKYKRSLAETENVRRRMQRQLEDAKLFSIQSFCKDLLEVADILQLAKESVKKDVLKESSPAGKELKQLHEGVVMTESQLQKIFTKHGLLLCDPLGEKFNPNIHEALFEIVDESKEVGTVAVVTKIGYLLHERPIRPAKVGIVKAPS